MPAAATSLRSGDTTIWMDCGNGTFPNLQQHIEPRISLPSSSRTSTPTTASTSTASTSSCGTASSARSSPSTRPAGLEEHLGVARRARLGQHLRLACVRRGRHAPESATSTCASRAPTTRRPRTRSRQLDGREADDLHRRHRTGLGRRRVRPRRRPRAVGGDVPPRQHPGRRSTSRRTQAGEAAREAARDG